MNDPARSGFSAGPYKDGTAAYVGHGNNNKNGCNQNPCPARISIDPAKPGAYMPCFGSETYDTTTAYYLLKHDDLRWVRTDYINMRTLKNTVQVTASNGNPFLYGRNKNGNYYQVGKVHNGNNNFRFNVARNDNDDRNMFYGYDVLVCDPSLPKTPTPSVTPPLPSPPTKCGKLGLIKPKMIITK